MFVQLRSDHVTPLHLRIDNEPMELNGVIIPSTLSDPSNDD